MFDINLIMNTNSWEIIVKFEQIGVSFYKQSIFLFKSAQIGLDFLLGIGYFYK